MSPVQSLEVSVLMSCYNSCKFLADAIESVLDQTFKDFEFIVVDDGSTDDTLSIISKYAERDKRIVVIEKPNTGLADSLNEGIIKARGEWIARLDADDICEPTRLEKQLDFARTKQELVFIGSGFTVIDQHGTRHEIYRYPTSHVSLLKHLRTARKFPPHSSAFYRTDTVRAIGSYRPRIRRAQDLDLWLRLSENGELASMSEPLVCIRQHEDQISHDEAGRRQMVDARLAMTSYWLRRYGGTDPVDADEASFDTFKSWVQTQLYKADLFEYYAYKTLLKTTLRSATMSFYNAARLLSTVCGQPAMFLKFFKERQVGETLPRCLAQDWMKQGGS